MPVGMLTTPPLPDSMREAGDASSPAQIVPFVLTLVSAMTSVAFVTRRPFSPLTETLYPARSSVTSEPTPWTADSTAFVSSSTLSLSFAMSRALASEV